MAGETPVMEIARLTAELEAARRDVAENARMAALGRMLAGIIHDISTPLGSLRSNNEVIRRSLEALAQPAPPNNLPALLEAARELNATDRAACERIASLVRAVKTIARGKETEPVPADVNELVKDATRLVEHEYRGRVALELDLAELPSVRCVPHAIAQVFLNLLTNAGQAVEGPGKVTVRTRAEGSFVTITISDTGAGISEERRANVFRDGFTTKPPGSGTGLGLAGSKNIVESHGGVIDFESEPGVCTTFRVRLPRRQPDDGAA